MATDQKKYILKCKCPSCNKENDEWGEVYYKKGVRLYSIEKLYITWCDKVGSYVLKSETGLQYEEMTILMKN